MVNIDQCSEINTALLSCITRNASSLYNTEEGSKSMQIFAFSRQRYEMPMAWVRPDLYGALDKTDNY